MLFDIVAHIASHLQPASLASLALASKECNAAAVPLLYSHIHITLPDLLSRQNFPDGDLDAQATQFIDFFQNTLPLHSLCQNPQLRRYVNHISLGEHIWDPVPDAACLAFCDLLKLSPNVTSVSFCHALPPSLVSHFLQITQDRVSNPSTLPLKTLTIFPTHWTPKQIDALVAISSIQDLTLHFPEHSFTNVVVQKPQGSYTRLEVTPIPGGPLQQNWSFPHQNLRRLAIRGSGDFTDYLPLLSSTPNLEALAITCSQIGDLSGRATIPNLKRLQSLDFQAGSTELPNWFVELFADSPIESFGFSNHPQLESGNDGFLKNFVAMHSNTLKRLDACEAVMTLDCLEYICSTCASLEGLEVSLDELMTELGGHLTTALEKAKKLRSFSFALPELDPYRQPNQLLSDLVDALKPRLQTLALRRYNSHILAMQIDRQDTTVSAY